MDICGGCSLNMDGECGLCGCPIDRKCLLSTEACPDKKWAAIEKKEPEVKTPSPSNPYKLQEPAKKACKKCQRR